MKSKKTLCIFCAALLGGLLQLHAQSNTRPLNQGWRMRQVASDVWYGATVPGCVHTDLLDNGAIEEPFYRLNEHSLQWIDKVDWEYECCFTLNDAEVVFGHKTLRFNGLDTYAEISLNGRAIDRTDNMFCRYEYDVTELLREGSNRLTVVFSSPIKRGIELYESYPYQIPTSDNDLAEIGCVEGNRKVSVFTRKAGYHYGWDWGSRFVTSGIWREVELVSWDDARIEDLFVGQQSLSESSALCRAKIEVQSGAFDDAEIVISVDGTPVGTERVELMAGRHTYKVDFAIEKPELWFPNGMGEQRLYEISASVATGGRTETARRQIGLRTIELVREEDTFGRSFYFKVNGIPVFMKGANYIPNDAFPSRVSHAKYEQVVETARLSNFNMLRVWGGGYYEDDYFYELCDRAGILVWQDFMFACSMYPGSADYLKSIRREAVDNVVRLRNHPCIALWCGNNEILTAWRNKGPREAKKSAANAAQMWRDYENIFHRLLPDVVNQYDPDRYYWSSSPSSGEGIQPQKATGDLHYWGVWWAKKPFETYATEIARFMSEYGFQSFPELSTIARFALPEDYDIRSEVMKSHQRSSIGNATIEYYMEQYYGVPNDFESFVYVGQVMQGEAIRYAIEAHRRARPFCMGSLYWQLNDSWPVASWSSMDYYLKWKAEQFMVRRAFESVLVSPFLSDESIKVSLLNDTQTDIAGTVKIELIDFFGKSLFSAAFDATAKAGSATEVWSRLADSLGVERDSACLKVRFESDSATSSNLLYLCRPRELKLPEANVRCKVERRSDGLYDIILQSKTLARNLYLDFGGNDVTLSDNWFDLPPRERITITATTDMSIQQLRKCLKIKTLNEQLNRK